MSENRNIRVYCPTHEAAFETPESPKIVCEIMEHALSVGFPNSEFWEFCCNCQTFTPSKLDKGEKARNSCYGCGNEISKRYVCANCKIVSFECDAQTKGKSYSIKASGIEPACPGCQSSIQTADALALHQCNEIEAKILTSRSECPFCWQKTISVKEQQKAEPVTDAIQVCPKCGADNPASSSFCKNCRHQLRSDVVVAKLGTDVNKTQMLGSLCPNCSTPIPPSSGFCGECGQAVKKASAPPPPPPPPSSKKSAEIFTYEGQTDSFVNSPSNNSTRSVFIGVGAVFAFFVIIAVVTSISKSLSNPSYNSNTYSSSNMFSNSRMSNSGSLTNTSSNIRVQVSKTPNHSSSDSRIGKTGTLNMDTNIRESASKDSSWMGTHYRGAKVTILDVVSVPSSLGGMTDWYKVEVTSYGNSMDPNKYGEYGKDSGSEDVGWVNSYPEVYEGNRKVRRTLISFD
jgi:ribosomal protein L40E